MASRACRAVRWRSTVGLCHQHRPSEWILRASGGVVGQFDRWTKSAACSSMAACATPPTTCFSTSHGSRCRPRWRRRRSPMHRRWPVRPTSITPSMRPMASLACLTPNLVHRNGSSSHQLLRSSASATSRRLRRRSTACRSGARHRAGPGARTGNGPRHAVAHAPGPDSTGHARWRLDAACACWRWCIRQRQPRRAL